MCANDRHIVAHRSNVDEFADLRQRFDRIKSQITICYPKSYHFGAGCSCIDKTVSNLLETLERVKRSASKFQIDFSSLYQDLTSSVNFCVGRFVGRFIGRVYRLGDEGLSVLQPPTRQLAFVLYRGKCLIRVSFL
jgi:hypothetical protein